MAITKNRQPIETLKQMAKAAVCGEEAKDEKAVL